MRIKQLYLFAAAVLAVICVFVYFDSIWCFISTVIAILMPFLLGFLVAQLVNPLADKLQQKLKLPRAASAIAVIIFAVGIIGGIIAGIIWKLIDEVRSIYENFPAIYVNLKMVWENIFDKFQGVYTIMPEFLQITTQNLISGLGATVSQMLSVDPTPIFNFAGNVAKSLPGIFIATIVFVLSLFFMVCDAKKVKDAIKKILGERLCKKITAVKTEIKHYVGAYICAQGILMLIAFGIMLIGFSILDIEYALLIAAITAVIDALPLFGSGGVLVPWAIYSLITRKYMQGVGLLIIYLTLVLTRQLTEPKIVSNKIGTHPICTLMSMYAGYKLFSIGGMIIGPFVMMLAVSFAKAGVFKPIVSAAKKIYNLLKNEITQIK